MHSIYEYRVILNTYGKVGLGRWFILAPTGLGNGPHVLGKGPHLCTHFMNLSILIMGWLGWVVCLSWP